MYKHLFDLQIIVTGFVSLIVLDIAMVMGWYSWSRGRGVVSQRRKTRDFLEIFRTPSTRSPLENALLTCGCFVRVRVQSLPPITRQSRRRALEHVVELVDSGELSATMSLGVQQGFSSRPPELDYRSCEVSVLYHPFHPLLLWKDGQGLVLVASVSNSPLFVCKRGIEWNALSQFCSPRLLSTLLSFQKMKAASVHWSQFDADPSDSEVMRREGSVHVVLQSKPTTTPTFA